MEIRALRESDDRSDFRSGDVDLDRFFAKFAGQNQFRHFLGVTYVAVEEERILGYATVAPGHVEVDRIPEADRRRLPRYPLPILRLARLAVAEAARGRGLGAALLRFALELALRTASTLGCVGVVVDALPDATRFYEKYGFVRIEALEGQSDARPAPVLMFLSLAAVRAASRPPGCHRTDGHTNSGGQSQTIHGLAAARAGPRHRRGGRPAGTVMAWKAGVM